MSPKKEPLSPEEAKKNRQEYQRLYYLAHREKAKEYQRQYNLLHKKKQKIPKNIKKRDNHLLSSKRDYNGSELQHSNTTRFVMKIEKILSGERGYIGFAKESTFDDYYDYNPR